MGVKDEGERGLFSRAETGAHTNTSIVPLLQANAGKSQLLSQQHGRKLLIQVVNGDEEEEEEMHGIKEPVEGEGTWATAASNRSAVPSTHPQDDLLIEDLDPLDGTQALSAPESQEQASIGERKEEGGGEEEHPSLLLEAGRVAENILHEFDAYKQRVAEKEEWSEEERVWRLAEKGGSTLAEDKLDLDEDTKRRLRERVRSTVDTSSLCF